jgi:hypothetical protein
MSNDFFNENTNKLPQPQDNIIDFMNALDNVILNLKVMGNIKNSDKLSTSKNNIEIDPCCYTRCVYRTYIGDSRIKTIEKLQCVVNNILLMTNQLMGFQDVNNDIINVPENKPKILQDLIPDMINAKKGLSNLKLTYKDDVLIENQIEMIRKKLTDQIDKIKNIMILQ